MIEKYIKKIIITILVMTPTITFASVVLIDPFTQKYSSVPTSPGTLISQFYNFALMAAGGLAMGAIVYGAILYTISSGNPSKQGDAKDWITQALLGLAILLGAYLILNTINSGIVNHFNLSLPPAKNPPVLTTVSKKQVDAYKKCLQTLNDNNKVCDTAKNSLSAAQNKLTGYNADICTNHWYWSDSCSECAAEIESNCEKTTIFNQ
ncbi:hypothetical protein M1513_00390 [Patescibacteria group bacterium]|nr:hypothetical protein [Patescibacteria group bacterium]